MFSEQIEAWTTDSHSIFDLNSGVLLNPGWYVFIDDHCWVCKKATIRKNSTLPKNSILGEASILTKHYCTPNAIYAGIPAKCVKTNINWSRLTPKKYRESQHELFLGQTEKCGGQRIFRYKIEDSCRTALLPVIDKLISHALLINQSNYANNLISFKKKLL